jgi:hypothetical protein
MSALTDFLLANPVNDVTGEAIIPGRLSKMPFKIKAMNGEQFAEYQKLCTAFNKQKKKVDFNSQRFNELVILNHTVEPNFRDAECIKKGGCQTPEQFLYKSLLAGEIIDLADKISTLSGFNQSIEEEIEEAKNS